MKALRSSPFLPAASALQVFILFCCVAWGAAAASGLALRQFFMKSLRSSPFLPSASLLQVAILLCCGVFSDALAGAAGAAGAAAGAGAGAATAAGAAGTTALAGSAACATPAAKVTPKAMREKNVRMMYLQELSKLTKHPCRHCAAWIRSLTPRASTPCTALVSYCVTRHSPHSSTPLLADP